MISKNLVSIITACYNSEKYISETIHSVLNQTYKNWELLIVDDCSTDRSISIVKEFQKQDSRIKLFLLEENSGAAVARNVAIKASKGEFVAFLDADDKWMPNKLEMQLDFMISNHYSFSHTAYELISDSGKKLNKVKTPPAVYTYNNMLYSSKIGCLTVVYNQKILGRNYMPLLRKRQDYALWLKILKQGEHAYGLPVVLAQYRHADNSISRNKFKLIKWNWKVLKDEQQLSYIKSTYYLVCNIITKILKK